MYPYRPLIESALVYSGGTHTFEDVVAEVVAGNAQFWPAPTSCIVTRIIYWPRKTELEIWLAAGNQAELAAMTPLLERWAIGEGCTAFRLIGRKGWERSYLAELGWHNAGDIIMEKQLNG